MSLYVIVLDDSAVTRINPTTDITTAIDFFKVQLGHDKVEAVELTAAQYNTVTAATRKADLEAIQAMNFDSPEGDTDNTDEF